MKKLFLITLSVLAFWIPVGAFADTDVTALPNLTPPATANDGIITYLFSAAQGSRQTEIKFDGVVGNCFRGTGVWQACQDYDANLPTWPATVDATEVGYLNGVSSAIQTQIDGKQAADVNLPTWPATVDATEVGYLNGVTSAIQTQLDTKGAIAGQTWTGTHDFTGATVQLPAIENGATSAGFIEYLEDSDNGTNYVRVYAPASISSNYNITYPEDSGGILQTEDTTATLTNKTLLGTANTITVVDSISWNAAGTNSDGTQCADPAEVTINSGPITYTTICADNDGSSIYGHVVMPDGWNAGTVTMTSEYIQTAADTNVLNGDIACMCRGTGETVNNTWGSEVAIDDAAVTGSNAVDQTDSAAITCNGTCAAGDTLFWRYQLDATGTTTAVATLHFVGWKMEYTRTLGD